MKKVLLVIGIIVIIGIAFAVGILVGKNIQPKQDLSFEKVEKTVNEEQKYADYEKVSSLHSEVVNTKILVRFNGILYGKSHKMIDYAGGEQKIGVIDKLIPAEYVPKLDGETNTKDIVGASVYPSANNIVLNYNNEFVLFEKYEEPLWNDNMAGTIKATVVKVNENNLLVMRIDRDDNELISVGIKEKLGFQKGQIVLIHFNGMIMETYPAQLGNVGKVEILHEKLDVTIPDNILRYCYNTKDKVNITISELTNSSISMTITDTNELPYIYAHSYDITKKVKNKDYTGKGQKIGEDTENSIAGFTRNRA